MSDRLILLGMADDHKIFRDGLRAALKDKPFLQVAWEVETGNDLMHKLSVKLPDVLLMDAGGKVSMGSSVSGSVKAKILDHVRGDTVIAYKQKRRKGFHKKKGHRTAYTKIKVTQIA